MPKDADYLFQPLSLEDALNLGLQLIKQHRERLPSRAVIRKTKQLQKRGDNTELRAFVVTLAWLIHRHSGSYLYGTMAHISNAVFNPENTLDKDSVKAWVSASPKPFI